MRPALGVLSFILTFLVVNRLVVARVPLPPEAGMRTKTEFLLDHLEDYDAIWIGSSATLYGLRPLEFNDELAKLGYPGFRIYNLGVGGMGSFETISVLRRVLAAGPKRLKWVFYEEPLFDALLWYPDIVNQRYIQWHDARNTLSAIRALEYAKEPPAYKAEEYESFLLAGGDGEWRRGAAAEHIELGLRRELAVGQGPRIYESLVHEDEAWPTFDAIAETDGWMDITRDPAPGAKKAHDEFLARPKQWDKRVANMIRLEKARPVPEGHYDLDSLRQLIADIRAAGAEPIMYVPPRGLPSTMMMSLADRGEIPTLFPFHITSEFPELLPRELHYDEGHFNPEGAALWSRVFAQRFARHLDSLKD
ncbi:hypothetical protein Poly30_25230 [Planctomycetes bacterium Poly30]|uniref:Uncharacterized protein n=1 Tax=Saltatorellus ferox TaxID=2528018 RepID=A0A518ESD7_9BACT|nr:hypothetical protein Poly30_25230 [Planctomycetes bacterium Poly30]